MTTFTEYEPYRANVGGMERARAPRFDILWVVREELTCHRCVVPLRSEDVDVVRDAGICPRCGDLVRGSAVREVGYRVLAALPGEEDEAPASVWPPPSSHEHRASSRSLSWWSEMPLMDGGVCVRVTSDSHALMPKLFAGLVFLLLGTGVVGTLLGTPGAQPPALLVLIGLGCAVGGGVTLGRGLWRVGQTGTFSFRGEEVVYTAGATVRALPTCDVLRFRPRMTGMGAATTRVTARMYAVEIVTTSQVVVVPLVLTGEERVHALAARLDSLLRTAQASAYPRLPDASSHPAAPSPPS